jgi:hypothetical protein
LLRDIHAEDPILHDVYSWHDGISDYSFVGELDMCSFGKLMPLARAAEEYKIVVDQSLDYHMPMINGIEMLNRLKQASRFDKIPKVIYSAVLNSKDVIKYKGQAQQNAMKSRVR